MHTDLDSVVAGNSDPGREIVIDLLCSAVKQERLARGSARRVAFRSTRYLFGGALHLKIAATDIAHAVGVTRESVRVRGAINGSLRATTFANLAELSIETIDSWHAAGWIELVWPDDVGTVGYRASDLLVALVRHHLTAATPTNTDAQHPLNPNIWPCGAKIWQLWTHSTARAALSAEQAVTAAAAAVRMVRHEALNVRPQPMVDRPTSCTSTSALLMTVSATTFDNSPESTSACVATYVAVDQVATRPSGISSTNAGPFAP